MERFGELLHSLVNESYIQQGLEEKQSQDNLIHNLLSTKQLPLHGWSNLSIEYLLQQIRMMDSNNFHGNIGVGEREGRIYSSLVSQRHYSLSHGIGRSGDIAEIQQA